MQAPAPSVSGLEAGRAHHCAGRFADAARCYLAALVADPALADGYNLLGLALLQCDEPGEAVRWFRHAAELSPLRWDVYAGLGTALLRGGQRAEAAAPLRIALALAPGTDSALGGLGLLLAEAGAMVEAEACYRAALRLHPDNDATCTNLGGLLFDTGRLDEARPVLERALRLNPGSAEALCNLGVLHAAAGRLAEAEACCRAALAANPEHHEAHHALGTTLLKAGRVEEGWAGFDRRRAGRDVPPCDGRARPRWKGEPLEGRTLLLQAEEGFGDSLQMVRFVTSAAAGGRVVLQVPPELARLFRSLPGALADPLAGSLAGSLSGSTTVVATGEPLPPFDLQGSLLSLPRVLGVRLDDLPGPVPYLAAAPGDVARWSRRVGRLPGLRVGLAWAGNPAYKADGRRSLASGQLAAWAGVPGVSFVSLQKGHPPPPGLPLHDWTAELHDFADTAALVQSLDLVVAVDTAVVHLAGALGRPVWLLNRFDACWRWMAGRDDSPWYPTLRQFRQPAPGEWDAVLERVGDALAAAAQR